MDKRTNFPALEARKGDLEHAHYEAQKQVADAAYANQPDNAKLQWLASIRRELDELSYVLDFFRTIRIRDARGWEHWQTMIVLIVALISFALSIMALWRG